jgi:hypothetical protein
MTHYVPITIEDQKGKGTASRAGGEDGGAALAEADAGMARGFAGAAENDLVSVG